VLKAFMNIGKPEGALTTEQLGWLVGIHLAFVFSGLMLAITDWFSSRAKASKA